MDDGTHAGTERTGLSGAQSLFLSLYLVLLAFFIALVSLAPPESERIHAVVTSLTETFSGPGTIRPPDPYPSQSGRVVAPARQVTAEIGSLFQAEIPAAQVSEREGGTVLVATFTAEALFLPGTATLRPGREALFDRVIAALASPPAGQARAMDIALSTGGATDAALPEAGSLERSRAVALARLAYRRGAPPDSLSVGLSPGPLDRVTLTFRLAAPADDEGRP
ncbi:hypothetical protein [Pararhodospirillum oryzae]|uniref:Motility protein B-like N-terminal domain-containing protein n=1 Tax=Pararhodospirillum oryzae TaxID=478448 RepID=A0A512H954_9PROT|nr:hypothetical protein [Pararhodospirillum oryzae]GEO81930.1 hypothetical protein ROR02_20610 [Pararhodospirillum oryzae]